MPLRCSDRPAGSSARANGKRPKEKTNQTEKRRSARWPRMVGRAWCCGSAPHPSLPLGAATSCLRDADSICLRGASRTEQTDAGRGRAGAVMSFVDGAKRVLRDCARNRLSQPPDAGSSCLRTWLPSDRGALTRARPFWIFLGLGTPPVSLSPRQGTLLRLFLHDRPARPAHPQR